MSDPRGPDPAPAEAVERAPADADANAPADADPIVDWGRTGRRMGFSIATITTLVVAGWLIVGLLDGQLRGRLLGELVGLGLLVAFAAEFVIVGGAALRGMLRAGERGDRLAGDDVSLLPPQVLRRRRR